MAQRIANTPLVHLVGFGSQARAWGQCLRASGWDVRVYLGRAEGPSFDKARELGFEPELTSNLPARLLETRAKEAPALVAMLCPDSLVGAIYRDHLAACEAPLTLVLAHGYAVYAEDLAPARPGHEIALLAPKAIGPKLWSGFQEAHASGKPHRLVAGFNASPARETQLRELAQAMGFAPGNLARATFEQEAVGDLISEQGLLCGGVFTLLEWTVEAMRGAGVPPQLIREECLTELELIAGLLREKGPADTFAAISQAAQAGTILMRESLAASDARARFRQRVSEILDRRFVGNFTSGAWKPGAEELSRNLRAIQTELGGKTP